MEWFWSVGEQVYASFLSFSLSSVPFLHHLSALLRIRCLRPDDLSRTPVSLGHRGPCPCIRYGHLQSSFVFRLRASHAASSLGSRVASASFRADAWLFIFTSPV